MTRRDRDDSLLLKGEELGGRYELTSKIGSGGFATIYSAHDLNMSLNVAIKVLKEKWSANEEFCRRFLQESKHHATLKHPRIVPVTDRGTTAEGRLFYVMDLLKGESLEAFLKDNPGPRPWDEVIPIIVQLCEGLDYAHRNRVIHRDIKPSNIFLEDREDLSVKILDLGIAKELPSEVGEHHTPLTDVNRGAPGTPEYMAPEQASTETSALDGRTDIYAIGVVMYLMLTGTLPFRAPPGLRGINRHITLLQMHRSEEVEPLGLRAPEANVPPLIEGVVMQALAKRPEDRFESARDLRDSLLFAERRLLESSRLNAYSGHERERRLLRVASGFSSLTTAAALFLLLTLVKLPGVQCAAETIMSTRSAQAQPGALQAVAPQAVAPQAVAPQAVAPQPVDPQAVDPPDDKPPDDKPPNGIITSVDDDTNKNTNKDKDKDKDKNKNKKKKTIPPDLLPVPPPDPAKLLKALASRSRSSIEKKCASGDFPSTWQFELSVDKTSKTLKVVYLGTKGLTKNAKCALSKLQSVSVDKKIRAGAPLTTTVVLKV